LSTPIIQINNGSGSDTLASGSGPSVALTGTAASTSSTGLVVTLDGSPDLTAVATDGSHVIWVNTASGRQFAAITAKDNTAKTVTTTTAYTASLTGKTWAIGGKRATLDDANTRKLGSAPDAGTGWTIDLQDTGTAYTLASTWAIAAAVVNLTISSSTPARATVTTSTNAMNLFTFGGDNALVFRHLKFTHTAATTRGRALYPLNGYVIGLDVSDCVFDGFTTAIDGSFVTGYNFPALLVDSCEFKNGSAAQIINTMSGTVASYTLVSNCFFHDNAAAAIGNCTYLSVEDTVFVRNLNAISGAVGGLTVRRCVIRDQTGAGITVSGPCNALELSGNVVYGNASTGVVGPGSSPYPPSIVRNNAFGEVALTADPHTNAGSNDFTLNSAAGGGALLKGVINNVLAPGLAGTAHGDLGPFQSASAGSSGGLRTIGLNGGF
jgi:hypothetical protein